MINKMKIKKNDTVVITTGQESGKKGKVLAVIPKTRKVVVEGCNIKTKHHKQRSQQDKSEIRKIEASLDVSNVMIVCPSCTKGTRVGFDLTSGTKTRVCKKCGKSLDVKPASVKAEKKTAPKAEVKEEVKAEAKTPAKTAAAKQEVKKPAAKKEAK